VKTFSRLLFYVVTRGNYSKRGVTVCTNKITAQLEHQSFPAKNHVRGCSCVKYCTQQHLIVMLSVSLGHFFRCVAPCEFQILVSSKKFLLSRLVVGVRRSRRCLPGISHAHTQCGLLAACSFLSCSHLTLCMSSAIGEHGGGRSNTMHDQQISCAPS
jgi:hypothetical protein